MRKQVLIDGKGYVVNEGEFIQREDVEFCNLYIMEGLGEKERLVSFLKEVNKRLEGLLMCYEETHGGYVCLESSVNFEKVYWKGLSVDDEENIEMNIKNLGISHKNVERLSSKEEGISLYDIVTNEGEIIKIRRRRREEEGKEGKRKEEEDYEKFLFCSSFEVLVKKEKYNNIKDILGVEGNEMKYNNLLCLAMIVKNGGESFRDILRHNKKYIDTYCILDTGSTDGTVEVALDELKDKRGYVYREPFINFRDSRNRCLDLCGRESKYIITLDDTYMIENDLRGFLERVRGDQVGDSFSMYVKSNDTEYGSNRIIKTVTGLRYIYKIHEVINPENNTNIIVPKSYGSIFDYRSDYMEKRTMDRKEYDIKILKEMLEDDPMDSRAYYYLGQTYNLLGKHEMAYENFIKRVRHESEGFVQEKIDACFEAARLSNFWLKDRRWEDTEKLYMEAYRMDVSRPDSLYFIGIHYYLNQEYEKSYVYFKEAYRVGYPEHCQYSLKPTLSYFFLPKFLCEVCYVMSDFQLGKEVGNFFMEKNREEDCDRVVYHTMRCWIKIFTETLKKGMILNLRKKDEEKKKKKIVFVVDGGFESWSGESIERKGVGGSETHVIEMGRCFYEKGFEVVVFCHCGVESEYEGVKYRNLSGYIDYLETEKVDTVFVSRYPEYLGRIYMFKNVGEVVLILHDMIPDGEIILRHKKLKKIVLLSEFHKEVFDRMYGTLSDITVVVGYGINVRGVMMEEKKKTNHVFMYSSMANRGLYNLLLMWGKIREKYKDSVLLIHCDLENEWLNRVEKDLMVEVKRLVRELSALEMGVEYRGWTSKKELYESWKRSSVWFHPTSFLETYCLTALEAAMFGCLCVTDNVGSLKTTVGEERGYLLKHVEGKDVVEELFEILLNEKEVEEKVKRNYEWACEQTWERRCEELLMYMSM